ncbi:MAG: MATE family efflux transporter [Clostridia bacterium]|nr:MATE family efflux transporter [Clostridia bacterium]
MNIRSLYFHKPFWKTAIPLALPIALQNLMAASFSLIDTFMVAGLGSQTLSAVGMASQYTWLFNIVIFGLASGTALFVSQYWGGRDRSAIHRTEGMALMLAIGTGLLFFIIGALFPEAILSIFNKDEAVIKTGSSYIRYACFSYPAYALNFTLYTVLRSTEKVRLPMVLSVFNAGLNAVLNYGLIYGRLGLPEMGAAGAALATSLSCWVTTAALLATCLIQKNIVVASLKKLFIFTRKQFSAFMRKTLPAVLNEGVFALGTTVLNITLSNLSVEAYAGVTILRTVENLAFVFIVGLCNACSIIVGKSIGAGDIRGAREDATRFLFVMPLFSLITSLGLILLRSPLVSLFTYSGEYTDVAVSSALYCILIYALNMPLRNVPYLTIVGIFRPGGDPKTGMICDVSALWFISIPLTVILSLSGVPFEIVFLCMYLSEDIPKTALCLWYFASGKWIHPVTPEGKLALEQMKKNK